MFAKKRKLGQLIDQLHIGQTFEMSQAINDKDILLYLGFTDDANPVYIQHDYTARTPYKKPIVPNVMINGIVTTVISMHLPGPGSTINKLNLSYPHPLYHYGTLSLKMKIKEIDHSKHKITIEALGVNEIEEKVLEGEIEVTPPYPWKPMTHDAGNFENF
ncbi:enoyl-CoA hydratase [Evansella cellulosilytica]|uniref:MaoC domain protein dehydratase n=1 Tax=Evansella cellulosilytica (strain ATCC 21833 / DSM 2522 / FERM P-1141 / JCM 9156 / N-4) TaxID=649639 RepID=E6U0L4_EVAC2|nr:enoyl-CoA hydratase [Evansella cellulosilytica]ADU31459.1 MaoC domain protein dehydratase [Evansella cellulosilytica DSM 2522]